MKDTLTTIIHFLHDDGTAAFNGVYKYTINEDRIKFHNDARFFDWADDGNDIDIKQIKYTLPVTGATADKADVKQYFELYEIDEIQYFMESKALGDTVAAYLKEWDEIEEKESTADFRAMNELYNSLEKDRI